MYFNQTRKCQNFFGTGIVKYNLEQHCHIDLEQLMKFTNLLVFSLIGRIYDAICFPLGANRV